MNGLRKVFLLSLFLLFGVTHGRAHAVTYSGTYTNGLTVPENGAIVENADISNNSGGVCLNITGDNVIVRNVKVHDCKDHGVRFLGTNGGILENSEIYRAAMKYAPNTVGSGWASLVKTQSVDETSSGLAQNIIIRNNYIHEGDGECIGLRGPYNTVSGNTLKDCYSIGLYSNTDHVTANGNFILCTGNPQFNRAGLPMVGIGFAEESFSNWGAHGHDSQKVINNIVSGCKYGFKYGESVNNKGLTNSVVAFNTFYRTTNSAISINYYSNQTNNIIENNIASSISVNPQGMRIAGNVSYTFPRYATANDFRLAGPLPAQGSYTTQYDFTGAGRSAPLDAGAMDFGGSGPTVTQPPTVTAQVSTPTRTPTRTPTPSGTVVGDLNGDRHVDIFDYNILLGNFGRSGNPGFVSADINRDGGVDIFDYNLLLGNFGR